jgi:adenylyltransferase/sulfurtransferase
MRFEELRLRRDPECPACGDAPTIEHLIDYEQFCGLPGGAGTAPPHEDEVSAIDAQRMMEGGERVTLIDVREPHERDINQIPGAVAIPLGDLPARMHELDTAGEIIVHCLSGQRSARAVEFLKEAGFRRVWNLRGGIRAWGQDVDPSMRMY